MAVYEQQPFAADTHQNLQRPLLATGARQRIGEKRPPIEHWSERPTFASPTKILMVFLFVVVSFGLVFVAKAYLGWGDETGKSLLITYHGQKRNKGSNDVFVYNLRHYGDPRKMSATDGLPLFGLENIQEGHVSNLRVPVFFNDTLYVANAYRKDSKIWEYKNVCGNQQNGWDNTNNLIPFRIMDTCIHPYGIEIDEAKNELYVSCQTSGHVEKYDLSNPNSKGEVVHQMDQPRDISLAPKRDLIFISDRYEKQVKVLKLSDPSIVVGELKVRKPIGLVIDNDENRLFVGSATGHVKVFDISEEALNNRNFKEIGSIQHKHLTHPAGMSIDDDLLFVVGQDSRRVYSFDLRKEAVGEMSASAHLVIGRLHKRPEGLDVCPCVPAVQTTPE